MENKALFAIDGNWFLHKTLSVIDTFNEKTPRFAKDSTKEKLEEDRNALIHKFCTDLSFEIRKFSTVIDDIVIAIDSPNWRKDFFENVGYKGIDKILDYKGNRDKSSVHDWSEIYRTYDILMKELEDLLNIKAIKLYGAEADDILLGLSTHYTSNNKLVIICANDKDINQVAFKSNDGFTLIYKKDVKKIILNQETANFLYKKQDSVFVANLVKVCNDNSLTLEAIDTLSLSIEKMLCGDDGDNVFPVISEMREIKSAKSKNKGELKEHRFTSKYAKKVKEELDNSITYLDLYNDDFIETITNSVIRNFKPVSKFNKEDIKSNIKVNRDLVVLHKNSLPSGIWDDIIQSVESSKLKPKANIRLTSFSKEVLKDLKCYTDSVEKTTTASIFKYLDL